MERRRLERERQKTERTKLSSPKRIPETSVIPDEGSEHEDFDPWEDVEETQDSPRSDVTVSRVGFRVKVLPTVDTRNSWFWHQTYLLGHVALHIKPKTVKLRGHILFSLLISSSSSGMWPLEFTFSLTNKAVYICRQNQMAHVPLFDWFDNSYACDLACVASGIVSTSKFLAEELEAVRRMGMGLLGLVMNRFSGSKFSV